MGKKKRRKTKNVKNIESLDYYDRVIEQFDGIVERFREKPLMLLLWNGVCGLFYWPFYEDAIELRLLVYVIGVLFAISVFLCLISMIACLFKKGDKVYPMAISAVLNVFCLLWNMIALASAIDDCREWVEWIPVVLFMCLSLVYVIYAIIEMRKEICGAEPKQPLWVRVPMWVIWMILFLILSFFFFYSRRHGLTFLGELAPDSLFSWYWAFFSLLLNYCMTRLNINSVIYCKLKIVGRKKK